MKKYKMIGVNTARNEACLLECLLPFNALIGHDDLERDDFKNYAPNWGGCDTIERIITYAKANPTGRKIKLKKPIEFRGEDYDHGHAYGWTFNVDEIHELTEE